MNVRTVKYFLAVCEAGNFTKAAAANGISQPSLSLAIQRLEQNFGGRLFDRSYDGVSLTELGSNLRPILKKLVRIADQAILKAREVSLLRT
jgi:LysR family transcriptional regulator, hydrogen peroxide-inducible genes activator